MLSSALFSLVVLATTSAAQLHHHRAPESHIASKRGSCQAMYSQCGGLNFDGPTCCETSASCVLMNPYYSQCLSSGSSAAAATTGANVLVLSSGSCTSSVALYAQCGGTSFTGSTCCASGSTCTFVNDWYSQCLASTAGSSSTATKTPSVTSTTRKSSAVASKSSTLATVVRSSSPPTTTRAIPSSSPGSTSKDATKFSTSSGKKTSSVRVTSTSSSASAAGTSSASTGVLSTYTGKQAGDGTYYGTSDAGAACLLPTRTDQRFVAFAGAAWDNSEWCGGCIRVTGPSGSVDVQVTNECPECAEGSLDLATDAFAQISPTSAGRISITWDWIDCKSAGLTTGDVTFAWKSGSTAYWAGIQPRGGRVAVSSVSIKETSASSYTALTRENYNYWVAESGVGAGPFTVLVDWQDGTSTTSTGVVLNAVIGDA